MPERHPEVVLASGSPRRRSLLAEIGIEPTVVAADIDESVRDAEAPPVYVERLGREKVIAVAADHGESIVIGADTTVSIAGDIIGKPADARDAATTLRRLSGRAHDVFTGVAVGHGDRLVSAVSHTEVVFAPLTDRQIEWYVGTREPLDKAGSYALQGAAAAFVTELHGSYDNVIGLPRALLDRLLGELGTSLIELGSAAH